jgi:hypothetical protein
VDQGDGVVAEQRVRAAGDLHVVRDVVTGLFRCHAGQGVADRDPLIQRGENAEP